MHFICRIYRYFVLLHLIEELSVFPTLNYLVCNNMFSPILSNFYLLVSGFGIIQISGWGAIFVISLFFTSLKAQNIM